MSFTLREVLVAMDTFGRESDKGMDTRVLQEQCGKKVIQHFERCFAVNVLFISVSVPDAFFLHVPITCPHDKSLNGYT